VERKRVLMGWELGGGLGHLMRLREIARSLLDDGCEVVLAAASARSATRVFAAELERDAFRILQAPLMKRLPPDPSLSTGIATFADTLASRGLGDIRRLFANADAWFELVRQLAPDLIVSDWSPGLNLAVRDVLPTIVVGNGYTIPPKDRDLPPIAPWVSERRASSAENERRILDALNAILRANSRPPMQYLGELFHGDRTFICTFPEFDPYGRFPGRNHDDPFNIPIFASLRPVASRPENEIFIYLPANHPKAAVLSEIAAELRLRCTVFIEDIEPEIRAAFAGRGDTLLTEPADLAETLQRVRLVVHHGGLAMTHAALRAGTQQLLLPLNLEHQITAAGLEKFGACAAFYGGERTSRENILEACRTLLNDRAAWATADANCRRLLTAKRGAPLQAVLDECRAFLSSSPARAGRTARVWPPTDAVARSEAAGEGHRMNGTMADRMKEAMADHQAGRLADAERKYREILAAEPNQAHVLYLLGGIDLQMQRAAVAIDHLGKAVAIDGEVPEFHNRLGEAHLMLRQVGEAVQCFGKALQLRPYFGEARVNVERAAALAPGRARWSRQVMYAELHRLLEGIGPERLDVLEISGDSWKGAFKFKSYKAAFYPAYDVCQEPRAEKVDLIILDQVLEHVRHPDRAIRNVVASLRNGGYCLVSTPFLVRVHPAPLDLWRWTEAGLRCLLEDCGFAPEKVKTGAWGNRDCAVANFTRWEVYDPARHSLENEPDFPVTVWALAQVSQG
jgi:rhamnosyltransferase subunit B